MLIDVSLSFVTKIKQIIANVLTVRFPTLLADFLVRVPTDFEAKSFSDKARLKYSQLLEKITDKLPENFNHARWLFSAFISKTCRRSLNVAFRTLQKMSTGDPSLLATYVEGLFLLTATFIGIAFQAYFYKQDRLLLKKSILIDEIVEDINFLKNKLANSTLAIDLENMNAGQIVSILLKDADAFKLERFKMADDAQMGLFHQLTNSALMRAIGRLAACYGSEDVFYERNQKPNWVFWDIYGTGYGLGILAMRKNIQENIEPLERKIAAFSTAFSTDLDELKELLVQTHFMSHSLEKSFDMLEAKSKEQSISKNFRFMKHIPQIIKRDAAFAVNAESPEDFVGKVLGKRLVAKPDAVDI